VSRFTLDPDALRSNLGLAREWAPDGARVRAMVKANAYGHGLEELVPVFAEHADEFGVATLDEGLDLRSWLDDDSPLYLVSGAKDWSHRDYLEAVREARLIPAVSSVEELRLFADLVKGTGPVELELKFDTGMGRLGIQEGEVGDLVSTIRSTDDLQLVGLMTHYASSDEEDLAPTREQDACFQRILSALPDDLVHGASIHSCNSGALMQRCLGQTDIARGTTVVRPGVMLYGAGPSRWLHDTPAGDRLKAVGRWTTRVIEVRRVEAGGAVGYGGTWRNEGDDPVKVAVLAVGYADGFRRILGNRSRVLIRGGSFPVIGRVSMDLVSVLVNDRISVGDEAVLLGSQGGELGSDTIPAWEWAELCDTIPYEIWTSIGSRVERVLDIANR
jgi:alanine racemase